jgi:hypothetical protein
LNPQLGVGESKLQAMRQATFQPCNFTPRMDPWTCMLWLEHANAMTYQTNGKYLCEFEYVQSS